MSAFMKIPYVGPNALIKTPPRHPDDSGQAVNHEQHHCLPLLRRVGRKHHAPADGYTHKQQHSNLNEPADVEAISQSAGVGSQ